MPSPRPTPTVSSETADQVIVSPDGNLTAKRYNEYGSKTGKPVIVVSDISGQELWTVEYQRELPTGDPRPALRIYRWSKDSSRLYFYYAFSFDGYPTLWDGYDLQVLSLATGKVWRMLPGEGLMAFAFSPSESHIAYARNTDEPRLIIIRDLRNGEEATITVNTPVGSRTQVGWIEWSPDGDQLIYYIEIEERFFVVYLDIKTEVQRKVFDFWAEEYGFDRWIDNRQIRLISYSDRQLIDIDVLTTEQVMAGTATATP